MQEEFFDGVRRHICQVLGFDHGLIDLVRGHEFANLTCFEAGESEGVRYAITSLEDEQQQPLTVAHTLVAQKVKQTLKPWIGKAFEKTRGIAFPYAIVPIIARTSQGLVVRGLIRVVSLDENRVIDGNDLSKLQLVGEHLAERLPETQGEQIPAAPAESAVESSLVLVIHTNRVVRRRLSRIIGSRYMVSEADTGERTAELLQQNNIDLIVLDSGIAVGSTANGVEFCKQLKQSPQSKHIPLILVTGDNDVSSKIDGLNAGAEDVLFQECHEAELLARVRASLRLRKTQRDLAIQWQMLDEYAHKLEKEFETEKAANMQVSKYNATLERVNQELAESKLEIAMRAGQQQLLNRVSDIIRMSFDINVNVARTLEELSGYYNLDSCFAVLPTPDEPTDSVRCEYASEDDYRLMERDLDERILEIFSSQYGPEQQLVVSDVARDRAADPFRVDVLKPCSVKSLFYIPITYEEKLLGILGGHRCESEMQWTNENKSFLKQIAGQIAIGVTNARLYARLQRLATTDGLTGLYNHRTGQEKLLEQMRLAERYQRNISVCMIDVDHFKSINDTWGHPAGDTVLRSVASLIKHDCRDVDIPVRYGGEEFLLILPEVNQEGAVVVAERIRRKLSKEVITHDGIEIAITASLGVAAFPDDAQNQQQLLDLADKALYMSKRLGRNQVHTAGDLMFSDFVHQADEPEPVEEMPPEMVQEFKEVPKENAAPEPPKPEPATLNSPVKVGGMDASPTEPPSTPKFELLTPTDVEPPKKEEAPTVPPPKKKISPSQSPLVAKKGQRSTDPKLQALPKPPSPLPQPPEPDAATPARVGAQASPPAQTPVNVGAMHASPTERPNEPESESESETPKEMANEVVDVVKALASALYSRSEYNKVHHLETARFAELLAKVMGLSQQQVEQIRVAGLLHDVGVLSIPEEIINKPGLVSAEEMEVITKHPSLGADLLRPIKALRDICDIVENHHECWDGTGYPRGLKGEEIPLSARIIAIVDAYHAMISDRPYRAAMSKDQARKALKNGAGSQWDPFLVDIFLAVLNSMDAEQQVTAG